MPDRSNKVKEKYEAADEYELPYISKSRVEKWLGNPEHFRLKYLEEIEEPTTEAMIRGTRVHEAFEGYYENLEEGPWTMPNHPSIQAHNLPEDRTLWADFVEPYISNFFLFEQDRWAACDNDFKTYKPVSIEEEHWRDDLLDEDAPEFMGLADAIYHAVSVPWVDENEGVVITDFKTGGVPDEQYRSPGIYTELAYYTLLFEDKYDVVGSMAYYPKTHDTVVNPNDGSHREKVFQAAEEMIAASQDYDGSQKFKASPGPLCGWSPEEGDRSALYGLCSQCTWNVPVDNRNQFETLVEEGYTDREIANHLGCNEDECRYWRYKLNL